MNKSKLSWILSFIFFSLLIVLLIWNAPEVKAQTASHVVISEVQISPKTSDFIELYNSTSASVNLEGYRLVKRSSTGATDSAIISFEAGNTIPSHGFFLWCNSSFTSTLSCDATTAATITNNNSIALRNGAKDTGIIVDAVTIGNVANPLGEGTAISPAPNDGESIERKAHSNSTVESMTTGEDKLMGNGEDTDDNINDFIIRPIPEPQNSNSALETPSGVTITISITPSDTITTTPTETATPSPTLTDTPTPTGTISLTPTISVTPTATPSPTIIPFPQFPHYKLVCTTKIITVTIPAFSFKILIPIPSCNLIKL